MRTWGIWITNMLAERDKKGNPKHQIEALLTDPKGKTGVEMFYVGAKPFKAPATMKRK